MKILTFLFVLAVLAASAKAIGLDFPPDYDYCEEATCVCGDEECVLDESFPFSPFYCAADCVDTCEDLGYIMPPDCTDYGYEECPDDLPSRAEVEDFCTGYGYVLECLPEDLDEACRDSGLIPITECPTMSSGGSGCSEDYCRALGFNKQPCQTTTVIQPQSDSEGINIFPWILVLLEAGIIAYLFYKNDKDRKRCKLWK